MAEEMTDYEKELKAKHQQSVIEELETEIESLSKKYKISKIALIVPCISLLFFTIGSLVFKWTWLLFWDYTITLFVISAVVLTISSFIMVLVYNKKKTAEEDLETAKRDVSEYQRRVNIREQNAAKPIPLDKATPEQIENMIKATQYKPICPICGSGNTERIGTMNGLVIATIRGRLYAKLGMFYQCNRCKHKW